MNVPVDTLAVWALIFSIVSVIVSPCLTLFFLVRLPADAFAASRLRWPDTLPRRILRVGVNVLGWLLVVLGIVLSIPGVPGQGLLTIVLGLLLVDFPGRGRLLRRIVLRPAVRTRVDRLRVRFGKPPFLV